MSAVKTTNNMKNNNKSKHAINVIEKSMAALGLSHNMKTDPSNIQGILKEMQIDDFESTFPPNGLTAVYWVYAVLTLLGLVITYFVITKKADRDAAAGAAQSREEENTSGGGATEKINNTYTFRT